MSATLHSDSGQINLEGGCLVERGGGSRQVEGGQSQIATGGRGFKLNRLRPVDITFSPQILCKAEVYKLYKLMVKSNEEGWGEWGKFSFLFSFPCYVNKEACSQSGWGKRSATLVKI